jgi:hypothetical protein
MEIIFKQAWIMFIAVTFANAFILKFRAKKYIDKNPDLRKGYEDLFKGIVLFGNIPWIVIAIGNLTGMTNSIFDFFNPRALNPIVLIFHASIIVLWLLSIRWIYFRNGAAFLERHPGFIEKHGFSGNSAVTAKEIKTFFPLMLLGGIVGMIMMWLIKIPTPTF